MKYEKHILDAFTRLGFSPRTGQVEAINKILIAYLDNKVQNVILSAPTGTGKSLIGAVTSDALTAILNPSVTNAVKSSIGLVSTNVLAKQYDATFSSLHSTKKYIMLK
jgi:Rad3-related DNA helicase